MGMGYTSPNNEERNPHEPSVNGVSMKPGAMTFSRIRSPIQSWVVAWRRDQRLSASLDAA